MPSVYSSTSRSLGGTIQPKGRGPKGRVLRPKGPNIEDRMAEGVGGVFGEGQLAPCHGATEDAVVENAIRSQM